MKEEKLRYSKYECGFCKDTFITDCKTRWNMVKCKCGETAVDDEEFYSRGFGKPKLLSKSNTLEELKEKL